MVLTKVMLEAIAKKQLTDLFEHDRHFGRL